MTIRINSKITLVGAGPGDPELITVRGMKALQSANVILYDALVGEELLDFVSKGALKVNVGKRAGQHRFPQEKINEMLVKYALTHGHVVRLKGGDPFVFGRGHEELSYAESMGISVEVVPGISSCISLTTLQKVPVTRRGLNESFWVLTGTTRTGKLSNDVVIAASSSATAIILMGMRKLREIITLFAANGKEHTPVLIVQNGSTIKERRVIGTVKDIADKVEKEGIGSPGIIVIGEVVALHPDFNPVSIASEYQTVNI